jgi:hypothetical protein
MEMTKHFVDNNGVYLGGFEGSEPVGGIEVSVPPHGLARWVDGAWIMPPAFATLSDAKVAMIKWIEQLEAGITGERSLGEKLSWPTKLMVAKEYLANQSGDVPAMIATEAALRETTPVELAELIVAKGMAFAAASSAIAGLRAKTEADLEAVANHYDYETVLTAAATQAETLKAQLGL